MSPFNSDSLQIDLQAMRDKQFTVPSIAVLDSGIDSTHPQLLGHIAQAWRLDKQEDERWVPALNPACANNDNFGHGTAVASIIVQMVPRAQITDYCVLGKASLGAAGMTLAALEHAIESGHKLINLSLAVSAKYRTQLLDLLEHGFSKGCIIIASQRNAPVRDLGLPAQLSYSAGVNCFSGSEFLQLAFNRRSPIEFGAIGHELPVAAAGGGFTVATGTSYATPVVTGLAALFLSKWPELEVFELKTLLKNACFSKPLAFHATAGEVHLSHGT